MKKLFKKKGYKNNILHGPARYIGMSAHDVGNEKEALEANCVIAVETGIYFQDKGWGVRIEDVVKVTKKGSKVLSDMIPVEIEEIERIMGER